MLTVIRIADGGQGGHHAGVAASFAEGVAGVLAPAIRVMHDRLGPALRQRPVECGEHELSPEMRRHGPANDAPRPDVEHEGEIEEAGPRRDVRDGGHPETIRARCSELPIHLIQRPVSGGIADRRGHEAPRPQALPARCAPQAGHTFLPDPPVDRMDQGREPDVLPGPCRRLACPMFCTSGNESLHHG